MVTATHVAAAKTKTQWAAEPMPQYVFILDPAGVVACVVSPVDGDITAPFRRAIMYASTFPTWDRLAVWLDALSSATWSPSTDPAAEHRLLVVEFPRRQTPVVATRTYGLDDAGAVAWHSEWAHNVRLGGPGLAGMVQAAASATFHEVLQHSRDEVRGWLVAEGATVVEGER